jgi:general secretion pathway protein I
MACVANGTGHVVRGEPNRTGGGTAPAALVTRGFTLIEVLVALTIISIALMASLRAVGSITASSAELRARTLAQWSAENRLTEIRVRREFPAVGRRNFPCPQGDLNLMCVENVYTTANPNFRRIEMQVYDADRSEQGANGNMEGGRLARLLGFAVVENNNVVR